MRKKILLLFLAFAGLLGLAACTVESEPSLTSIAFAGVEDLEVENGEAFNFLTGVTATGNDEVDYTDLITMTTTSSAVNVDTGELDTLQTGVHFVRYEVVVGEGESELVARHSRYITVKAPTVQEGELVVNPDMTDSISGWNDPSVVYIADGASMELSHEDGSLKAEVVAGSNFFTPRFGQMGVPFENGKTYEVSFRAKSSVEKEIALQVGELLAAAPWYVDFLPATIYRTIGTEWATYSYKFTMNQPEENLRGGILFGLGTVNGNAVNATMYFDDINIEESQPDADTEGPVLEGVVPTVEITSDQTFDPALGVTATDFGFGDVTHLLVIEIYNEAGTKISLAELFPEEGATPGTYTIMYTVGDPLGNYTRYTTTLIITEPEDMLFKDTEELVDGEFSATPAELPLEAQDANYQDITENGFWYRYDGSWSGAAATIAVNEAGQLVVDVTAVAGEPWHFMVKQKGISLEQGRFYILMFDAVASVERPIRVGFNPGVDAASLTIGTEMATYEMPFYYEGESVETRLELLFGDAVGTVTIDNVKLMVNEVPSQALTVTQVWDAGFSTWYEDYTDVTLRGLVVGFHDKGYVLQDPATAEMIAIHDSTNTPVLGDHVELVGQFNQSFDIARIKNVSSLTVLEQGLAPNWDTSNAVELPWTDLANFDIALYQGKLVKVTGLWAKLYSGDTSYARIAHDEAGTGSKQYDGAYIGLQNKANEMNLTGTLADIFTGLDTATEYSGLTLYLFFYDSTSSYEKAVILTDAFIVNPA